MGAVVRREEGIGGSSGSGKEIKSGSWVVVVGRRQVKQLRGKSKQVVSDLGGRDINRLGGW